MTKTELQRIERLGQERINKQGCLMKIIEYNDNKNIVVEFKDKYKEKIHTTYQSFLLKTVKNPYYPSVYKVGITGNKYPTKTNGNVIKEYGTWRHMLQRCFDNKYKEKKTTYKNVTCCEEWLLYENFYEWLHSQENFDRWMNEEQWHLDKDVFSKGNKLYSPATCCLVPMNVNLLFTKRDNYRGDLPIGVTKHKEEFVAQCQNPLTEERVYLGLYSTEKQAFLAYKKYKENLIKQIAQIEYDKDNITEKCYNAMINYQVEITD